MKQIVELANQQTGELATIPSKMMSKSVEFAVSNQAAASFIIDAKVRQIISISRLDGKTAADTLEGLEEACRLISNLCGVARDHQEFIWKVE